MQKLSCGLCCFHPLRHSSVLMMHRNRSVSFLSLLLCTGKQPITKQNLLFVPSNPKLQPPSFPSYTHHCLSKLFRLPASGLHTPCWPYIQRAHCPVSAYSPGTSLLCVHLWEVSCVLSVLTVSYHSKPAVLDYSEFNFKLISSIYHFHNRGLCVWTSLNKDLLKEHPCDH